MPTSVDQLSWTATLAKDRRRLVLRWALLVACMVGIFAVSSLSGGTVSGSVTSVPGPSSLSFRLAFAHVVEFGVLALLASRLFAAYDLRPAVYLWTATLVLAIGYAATDELHQAFVPGRVPAWSDLGYDSVGAVAGLAVGDVMGRLHRAVVGARRRLDSD